jgi:hypothetical protein
MKLDRKEGPSAADILNLSSKDKLVEILRDVMILSFKSIIMYYS